MTSSQVKNKIKIKNNKKGSVNSGHLNKRLNEGYSRINEKPLNAEIECTLTWPVSKLNIYWILKKIFKYSRKGSVNLGHAHVDKYLKEGHSSLTNSWNVESGSESMFASPGLPVRNKKPTHQVPVLFHFLSSRRCPGLLRQRRFTGWINQTTSTPRDGASNGSHYVQLFHDLEVPHFARIRCAGEKNVMKIPCFPFQPRARSNNGVGGPLRVNGRNRVDVRCTLKLCTCSLDFTKLPKIIRLM